jgi:hypothetical protein
MAAKRCPMCHRVSDNRAWRCGCGYEFGQEVAKTRELLRDQLVTAKIVFAIMVVVDLGIATAIVAAAIYYGLVLVPLFGFAAAVLFTARTGRKILIARESLRLLAPGKLPKATVVK